MSVATSEVFPSAKFISTDAQGNLNEVESVPATKASGGFDQLCFEAVADGVGGNGISVEILQDTSGSISYNVAGQAIQITLGGTAQVPAVPAVAASLVYSSDITFSAVTAGAAGNSQTIAINGNQGGGAIAYTLNGSDLVIDLVNAANTYTAQDLVDDFNNNASGAIKALFSVSVTGTGGNNLQAGGIAQTNLAGGVDGVNQVPAVLGINNYTRNQIKSDFDSNAPQAAKDLITISVSGAATANLNAVNSVTLIGGTDSTLGELEPSSPYLLIKQSDLHDLADDERTDARKLVWGVLHKASEHWAGLANQPENLKISKSFPSAADNGASLRQVYTVTAKYGVGALDLKAE